MNVSSAGRITPSRHPSSAVTARVVMAVTLRQGWTGEHHRGLDLALRDRPVALQERGAALGRGRLEAVTAIKADRPLGSGPGADERAPPPRARNMLEQRAPDALPLAAG